MNSIYYKNYIRIVGSFFCLVIIWGIFSDFVNNVDLNEYFKLGYLAKGLLKVIIVVGIFNTFMYIYYFYKSHNNKTTKLIIVIIIISWPVTMLVGIAAFIPYYLVIVIRYIMLQKGNTSLKM